MVWWKRTGWASSVKGSQRGRKKRTARGTQMLRGTGAGGGGQLCWRVLRGQVRWRKLQALHIASDFHMVSPSCESSEESRTGGIAPKVQVRWAHPEKLNEESTRSDSRSFASQASAYITVVRNQPHWVWANAVVYKNLIVGTCWQYINSWNSRNSQRNFIL